MNRDSARSWVVIVLIGLGLSVSHADRVLLAIAAPQLTAEQHLSGTELGILLSAFAWTYTFFQLPAGWLVDRFGPRRVMAVALVCWSLACAATGLGADLAFLMACRLLLGIFESPLHAIAHSTMAKVMSDRRRGLASAIYAKGTSLGPAFGTLFGSYLLLKLGWGNMFIVFGLGSLVFLIPWLMAVPKALDAPVERSTRMNWPIIRELLGRRAVWGISLGYFGFLYVFYVKATWLPTYLAKTRGLSTAEIAWFASASPLIAIVAGPAAGWFCDWLIGRGYSQTLVRKTAIGLGLLLSAAIVPAAYAQEAGAAAWLFVLALAGESIAAANMLALPSAVAPKDHAGFVGSLQQMMGGLGGIASPILTGILFDATQRFETAILFAGAMLGLAGLSFLVLTPRIERLQLRTEIADPAPTTQTAPA